MSNSSDYSNHLCRLYKQEKEVVQVLTLVVPHNRLLQNCSIRFLNLHIAAFCSDMISKNFACDPSILSCLVCPKTMFNCIKCFFEIDEQSFCFCNTILPILPDALNKRYQGLNSALFWPKPKLVFL